MKASELRIGNYVNHNHSIGMELIAQITEGKDIDMFDEFEPIPLTEEWLLKTGFVPNGFSMVKGEFDVEIWLESEIGHTFKWNDFVISISLKHVHQLQNLYFALTGEELEINLNNKQNENN